MTEPTLFDADGHEGDLKRLRALLETIDKDLHECGLGCASAQAGCDRDFDRLAYLLELCKELAERSDLRFTDWNFRRVAGDLEP